MAKYLDLTLDGTKRIAAVIQLPQSPFSAKRKKQPPIRQPNDASRSRECQIADQVERMITAQFDLDTATHVLMRYSQRRSYSAQ
jgi:hypothetical protein